MIKKSVPHFFTSLNLLSGCFSIYFAYIFQFETAFIFLLAGVFFDVWDGLFARLLKVESELGVQLDSMADMVTCGVAPGIILAQLFVMAGNKPLEIPVGWPLNAVVEFIPWVFIGFLIPLGAAFRLARFNIDGSKKNHFIGLPTPAMAMFFGALPLLIKHPDFSFLKLVPSPPTNLRTESHRSPPDMKQAISTELNNLFRLNLAVVMKLYPYGFTSYIFCEYTT